MNRWLMIHVALLIVFIVNAQPAVYSVRNAHSHNDYEQKIPFYAAYDAGFASIEADIFLVNGTLFVAHDTKELALHRTLSGLYLDPLVAELMKHKGYPYADTSMHLQMLIDIKTDSMQTLETLIETLRHYEVIMNSHHLHWVITGNRPAQSLFITYPSFISFDGELDKDYSDKALSRIAMMSADWRKYSVWKGLGELPAADILKITARVEKAHVLHKPVRFWAAPDHPVAWNQLIKLRVDFINTDHIPELARYLKAAD